MWLLKWHLFKHGLWKRAVHMSMKGEWSWQSHGDGTKPSLQQRTEPQRGRSLQRLLVFPPADPHGYRRSPRQDSHRDGERATRATSFILVKKLTQQLLLRLLLPTTSHSCLFSQTLNSFISMSPNNGPHSKPSSKEAKKKVVTRFPE